MAKKIKVGFSLEHVNEARLLVLPLAEPTPSEFERVIKDDIRIIWGEDAATHVHDVTALRTAHAEGRVLWGSSEYRVKDPAKLLTWSEWDEFMRKHFGVVKKSPDRPNELTNAAVMSEARFLLSKDVFTLQGILLAAPEPKKTAKRAPKRKVVEKPENDDDDDEETAVDRWSYAEVSLNG